MSEYTREQLEAMTVRRLREVAREEGCCLGYDASTKAKAVSAILRHQEHRAYVGGEAS